MTHRRNGFWAIAVALAILGLVASACQQGTAPQPPSAQADPEGELVVPLGAEPDTIDPQKESFVDEVGQTMLVFDALMTFDAKSLKPVPAAAKDLPKLSADGLTYTFTLKDGLKYSDGQPVAAANFVYAFKRLCDPAVAGEYAFTGYIVEGCEKYNNADTKKTSAADLQKLRDAVSVKAIDTNTVEYKLTEKAPYFLSIAALWVGVPTREDMVKKGGEKWTEPETFIGNGWFTLKEWKHNEKIVYERNPNHQPQAKLKRIVKPVIAEASVAFAAYRNNEIDIYGVGGEDRKVVEGDATLSKELVKSGDSCTFYYGFNVTKPPFDDANVRLAFAKAFDREAYNRDINQGIGTANASFMPPGFPNYDPDDANQKFDAAAAKQLIAQSKYASSMPKLTFSFSSSQRNKTRSEWAVGQWKQNLGVDVALDPQDRTTYTKNVKQPATTPQIFLLGWCADYPDTQDWLTTVFHSTSTVSHTGWKNTAFDTLVRQADAEPDPAKREQQYKDAQRLLTKDAPTAFLYSTAAWRIVKPWIQNYSLSSMDFFFSIFKIGDIFVTKKEK